MNPIDRQILQIALPSIVSNITVPLLGLIDVAIVGHLGSPAYIGAIAVGGMLLSMAASAVSFFAVYYGFHTVLGNHALWLAFLVYLSMRGAMQTLLSRKVMEKSFH